MKRKKLPGLISADYEHDFDRKALNFLENTPGFEYLVKKFWEFGLEKMIAVQCTGSNLEVTCRNFPQLFAAFEEACELLNLEDRPSLYIQHGVTINAYATGVKDAIVVINSGVLDFMEEDEWMFILGHELGHIKSNHVLYHHMAKVIPYLANVIGQATFGIGNLASLGAQAALLNWQRMSEFTADRAGLLVCQNAKSAAKSMIKMAGLPKSFYHHEVVDEFILQAKKFEDLDYENLSRIAKILSTLFNTHPWTVMRCAEFFRWYESGEYENLFHTLYAENKTSLPPEAEYCPKCGNPIIEETSFCGNCGIQFVKV